jgi:hypothetical protein
VIDAALEADYPVPALLKACSTSCQQNAKKHENKESRLSVVCVAKMLWSKDAPPALHGMEASEIAHATIDHPIGKGCYYGAQSLHHAKHQISLECPDWEWADWDGERLIWVHEGVLFASLLTAKGLGVDRALYDFNPLMFEAIAAPY